MQPDNQPSVNPNVKTGAVTASKRRGLPAWLNRTGMYGFEQFMALIGLLTTAAVLDYGWFALFNMIDNDSFGAGVGRLSLAIVVAMIVWLPVTVFFFLRMRAQAVAHPETNHTHLAKFFNAAYLVIAITAAIGFAFTAIYSLLNYFVSLNGQSLSDVLLKLSLPALLSVLTELALVMAIVRPKGLFSRGKFAAWFSLLSLAVVVTLFVLSAGSIRAYAIDNRTYNDFSDISRSIQNYYDDHHKLPNRLDASLPELSQEVAGRLDNYQYVTKTDGKYQLCADFRRASDGYDSSQPDDTYRTYVRTSHPEGRYCYHLKVYGTYSPSSFDFYEPSRSLY
ncbi:MAG TPA: hypothetical protein VFK03_02260 [Candidatus Saccharimonadales bacterium]|nr:hypothetical protein [Candidatus Saccharimonadales bacterium]